MKTQEKKEAIIDMVKEPDVVTDEQVDLLYLLLYEKTDDKKELLKAVGYTKEERRKVDTATPIDYVRKIQEILPCFNSRNHVFDYNKKNFGEMFNVVEAFGMKVINVFNRF